MMKINKKEANTTMKEADEEFQESDPLDGIPEEYMLHNYSSGARPVGTIDCGSHKFKDPAKVLYRLLFYFGAGEGFPEQMYSTGTWLHICSPCYNFAISIEFYKYELAARFSCSRENHSGKVNAVTCRVPGFDNGSRCISEDGQKWFDEFMRIIESEHWIYPGSNFVV